MGTRCGFVCPESREGLRPFWNFILVQEFSGLENADEYPWTEEWGIGPHSKYGCKVNLTPA